MNLVNKSDYIPFWKYLNLNHLTYKEYLQSSHWIKIANKFKKDKCEICNSDANLNLHHLSYKNMGRETLKDVCTLCIRCHKSSHYGYRGGRLYKLKKPSNALANLVNRIRNKSKSKTHIKKLSLFLRKNHVAAGNKPLEIKHYRKQAKKLTDLYTD